MFARYCRWIKFWLFEGEVSKIRMPPQLQKSVSSSVVCIITEICDHFRPPLFTWPLVFFVAFFNFVWPTVTLQEADVGEELAFDGGVGFTLEGEWFTVIIGFFDKSQRGTAWGISKSATGKVSVKSDTWRETKVIFIVNRNCCMYKNNSLH